MSSQGSGKVTGDASGAELEWRGGHLGDLKAHSVVLSLGWTEDRARYWSVTTDEEWLKISR